MKKNNYNLVDIIVTVSFQFIMRHYIKLKPLFIWVNPQTRSAIKATILRPVFKFLHSPNKPGICINDLVKGVNLIGYPNADIGEGEFLRQTATSFLKTGVKFGIYDYNLGVELSQTDLRFAPYVRSDNPYKVNIFHLKPNQVEASIVALGRSFVQDHYNIGYWLWELARFPDAWMGPLKFLDEIWCPSRFIQKAIADRSSRPVLYMPPAIEIGAVKDYGRAYFKLPESRFLFLFVFDFKSYFTRKNPLACIRAFKEAFPHGGKEVGLIIKSMDGEKYPNELAMLKREVEIDSRVKLINELYSFEKVLGLMKTCDSFISLHRSEGIGLCIAQSMLLGKPVIVTNYSGNTDFTLPDNSCLVDYKLVRVNKGEYPLGENQEWAEPNVSHAASYMRRLVDDSVYRNEIARAGQEYIRTHHNSQTTGKIYSVRVTELDNSLS